MMNPGGSAEKRTFFAITSLGRNRWYWVVWPSLELLRSGEPVQHLADGYERSKAEAVDQALEVAGMHGEWVAAKHAREYHRSISRERRARERGQSSGSATAPAMLEFLYRDTHDEGTKQWRSVRHRVVKKTKKTLE